MAEEVIDLTNAKPKRKRRSKAEIEEDNRRAEAAKVEETAGQMRAEIGAGKTLRGRIGSTVLAALADSWSKIEARDNRFPELHFVVDQPYDNTIRVRLTFSRTEVIGKEVLIDDGNRELPL